MSLPASAGWSRGRGLWPVLAVVQELVVVGQHEGGEWQGDNHTQHAKQAAPYGEGQQDDGGIEARNLTHYLGYDDAILNDLNDTEDNHCQCQYQPKVLPCVGCFQQSEQYGGNQGYQLQVGNHVQQADEEAEAYGHGEIDNEESDAEQYAYKESYEGLATEIAVHAYLYVGDDGLHEVAVLGRDKFEPTCGYGLVIEQDEEYV